MVERRVPLGHYIISAFPGTGKTSSVEYCSTKRFPVLDLESGPWSHDIMGNIREDFPKNYVDEAIDRLQDNTFVLVSSHEQVRRELNRRGIRFVYVLPSHKSMSEYLNRYRERGNTEGFVNNVKDHWDEWLSPDAYFGTDVVMTLLPHQYVSDIIYQIKHNESLRLRIAGDL